jgi:pimeloyl-ACP methyl ester carboxylesterase
MLVDRRWLLRSAVAVAALAAANPLTGSAEASQPAVRGRGSSPRNGLTVVPLDLFTSDTFNDQALFALGAASSQSAEVGEVLRIAQTINARTGDPAEPGVDVFDAYCDVFSTHGAEIARLAVSSGVAHSVTTRNRLMRASTYAAQELFFVLGSAQGSREEQVFDKAQSRWLRSVALFDPSAEHAEVGSPFGPIPVHFFPSPSGSGRRPTVIISEGSDGQNVETMQFGVTAALARGYNVVLFEGPGQMTPLFKHNVMFTADWNRVVAPVLAWTRGRADVGKVALIGISFGGMLCSRAAARLKGLDAVVLEPAAHDFTTMWGDQKSMALVKETYRAPTAEKEGARRGLNAGFLEAWPSFPRVEQFTIYKRGSIFDRKVQREARAGRPLSDYYGLLESMLPFRFSRDFRQITIPTLVLANEGDPFFGSQPEKAYALLESVPRSHKALVHLTARKGASLHDQPVGPQVAEEAVFDWLDGQLR